MKRALMLVGATIATLGLPSMGQAATQIATVNAQTNSSSGGVGYNTGIGLTAGNLLTISVAASDLWSAGALPRWSDANGLVGDLFATGSDESGEAAGTKIGSNFGTWTQDGFTAPYGALVGKIGNSYQLLGTNFNGPSWDTGTLSLFYWDSNSGDNGASIDVNIAAVPEPAAWAFMLFGFAGVGFAMRRKKTPQVRASYKFS